MKITYLKLKNFLAIKTVMHINMIEIDFTKMVNPILLFIGPIGSCKTYILSHLQPFSHLGSVDLRNNEDMIIPEKDGEKEIHFINESDEYIIHHYYLYKKNGRTIKSYIQKNGHELNSSGLVTNFNQIISEEFGIDIGFLRILRLGTNVNNLVRLSNTERKEFAVKLLSEVDIYLKDYKAAVNKSRECNSELSIIADKLKKFGTSTSEYFKDKLDDIESSLSKLYQEVESINKEYFISKGKIETQVNSSIDDLRMSISSIRNIKDELSNKLNLVIIELNDLNISYMGDLNTIQSDLNHNKSNMEKDLSQINGMITAISESYDSFSKMVLDLDNQIKSSIIDESNDIQKSLNEALEFKSKYDKYFKEFDSKCTKQDLVNDVSIMQVIKDLILSIREFSSSARELYLSGFIKKNPKQFILNKLVKLKSELNIIRLSNLDTQLKKPERCTHYENCPFYQAMKPITKSVDEVSSEIDIAQEALKIIEIIDKIKTLLENRKDIFPYKVSLLDINNDIISGEMKFFDFEKSGNMITFLEQFETWKDTNERIVKYENELKKIQIQKDTVYSSILANRTDLVNRITEMETQLIRYRSMRKKIKKELTNTEDLLSDIEKTIRLNEEKKNLEYKLLEIEKEITDNNFKINLLTEFDSLTNRTNELLIQKRNSIKELESEQFRLKVQAAEFNKLQKQKADLMEIYKEVNLVKNAVSTKAGIPLLYLTAHFGKLINNANKIITSVCGDSLQLQQVIIDDKQFRIPYTKNGILIPDIINASQGETSVISMALSFALIEEFLPDKYNILLLDEIDGPLDVDIRSHLLHMLENRMRIMHCEQIFMITHSALFENYPVDVFVTMEKENQLDGYKNINLI